MRGIYDIHELVFHALRMNRLDEITPIAGLILIRAYGHATGQSPSPITNNRLRRFSRMRGFELTHYVEMRAERIASGKMRG